jgi:hypothetical protein
MNRILHWITERLSRRTVTGVTDQRDSDHEERDVGKKDTRPALVTIRRAQPNIEDLTPNGYHEATGDTQPDLEIIESPSETPVISESFDPYDSGTYRVLKK